jgi:hypothetical protein
MAKFSTGEIVGFLHEKGKAEVLKYVNSFQVHILNDDGFEEIRPENDLIKIFGTEYVSPPSDIEIVKSAKKKKSTSSNQLVSKTKESKWEIDLHIEHLLDTHNGLSNSEILLKQLTHFRSTFSKAKSQRINKLIVIHGVGEGVLKNEIRMFLARQEHIEYFDASYIDYGKGATEIRFYHSKY